MLSFFPSKTLSQNIISQKASSDPRLASEDLGPGGLKGGQIVLSYSPLLHQEGRGGWEGGGKIALSYSPLLHQSTLLAPFSKNQNTSWSIKQVILCRRDKLSNWIWNIHFHGLKTKCTAKLINQPMQHLLFLQFI